MLFLEFRQRATLILEKEGTAIEKLLQMTDELLPLDELRLREARVWLAFWNEATMHQALARENAKRHQSWYNDLVPTIKEINSGLDAPLETELFMAITNGLSIQLAVQPTRKNRLQAAQTLRSHIQQLASR